MNKSKVMIVEDESIVAMDIEARLLNMGYDVVRRVTSGEEAIQHALNLHPDIILLDIQLRGDMDGIEAATQIRHKENIPIIYLSAYSDPDTIERAKLTTPSGYLIKPFNERELHTTIETALHKSQMEQKLYNQQQQLVAVFETIPLGIVMIDYSGRIVSNNKLSETFLDIIGNFTDGYLTGLGNYSLSTLLQNPDTTHEISVTDKQSKLFNVTVRHVDDSNKLEQARSLIVIDDVTRQQEILQQSYEHSNLATVGQLAAGIAHDFNNILSILGLTSQLLLHKEQNLSARSRERLNASLVQVNRGSKLVAQLLDFSRRSNMEVQPLDLVHLCQEVMEILRSGLPRSIELEFKSTQSVPLIDADATRIQQILLNLALNARDAIGENGTIAIMVDTVTISEQQSQKHDVTIGDWVKLTVADTGTGISQGDLQHIFEPFFTTKEQGKGTGLGLAQVYGIVQQHQGFIEVSSQREAGTCFELYFPAINYADEPVSIYDEGQNDLTEGEQSTILLVEDESMLRASLTDILEFLDYKVISAVDGVEALQVFEQHESQIVLMLTDVVMPNLGGLELCSTLRSHGVDIPFVVMSGYSSDLSKSKLDELDVSTFLQKPISMEDLSKTLAEIVE